MSSRILLVEDEPGLALTLADLLAAEGYTVETAGDGPSGLAKASGGAFDLVVLDIMLPGKNGLEICRELRQQGKDLAILMLTAKTQLTDRVVGLKLGADDYVTKPFEPAELLARIEALLRRVKKEKLTPVARYRFDGVEVDFERGQVRKNGNSIPLAAKELDLLHYLIDRRGKVVSREELLEGVWEYQPGVSSRTIDVHVAWLRQKLEDTPQHPKHIHTVRGVGYRFSP
jgi:two-component system, OmpR family, alkaline phosphatase synthesis response regulator PhoP